jgi:hypothetical protein
MSTNSIIERYARAVELWEFICPNIPVPPRERMVLWLSKYDDESMEKGFLAVPHRFRNRLPFAPEEAYGIVHQRFIDLNRRKDSALAKARRQAKREAENVTESQKGELR